MRHFAWIVVAACGASSPAPQPPAAPPASPASSSPSPAAASAPNRNAPPTSPSDPLSYCRLAVHAVDELSACRDTAAFATMRDLYDGFTRSPPQFARKSGAQCATFLESMLTDPEAKSCAFSFRERRSELGTFLDAYYATHTKLVPTGHAGADAVLATIAKHRDAMCACADEPCVAALHKDESWMAKPLPSSAPGAARDLAGALIDDISKCSADLRWMRPKK